MLGPKTLASVDLHELVALMVDFQGDLVDQVLAEDAWDESQSRVRRRRTPHLSAVQRQQLTEMFDSGRRTASEVGALFGLSRATVYRLAGRPSGQP